MKKVGTLLAATVVVASLVTACGGSSSSSGPASAVAETSTGTSPTSVAGPTITIANMAFGQPVTAAPGSQLNVVNDDSVEHSVTSQTAGAFDVHVDGGKRKILTAPTEPGRYDFYCVYHPSMKGTLIVA
jgi:plastocyanin